jgi:hypothetical protein
MSKRKRKECTIDDLDRMGSSPADSHFINNNQPLWRVMMLAVLCWIPTPERFSFFLTLSSYTLHFLLVPFLVVLLLLLFYFHMADTRVRDGRRRRRRRAGERGRTRVKDDCMSNLRHGDYDDVTFALVLLLHSFLAQPPSNPIRRTRLFLLCVRACMCARACAHIYYI